MRKYRNANMSPSKHAAYLRLRCLKATWPVEAVLAALEALTPDALRVRLLARSARLCSLIPRLCSWWYWFLMRDYSHPGDLAQCMRQAGVLTHPVKCVLGSQAHLERLLARVHVETLMQGNLSAGEAVALARAVREALPGKPLAADERAVEEVAALPEGSSLLLRWVTGL